jgi:hypothetical protein
LAGRGGDLGPALGAIEGSLKLEFGQPTYIIIMVAMAALCETTIRYTRRLVHLVDNDLAGGVEECGDSFGRRFPGVMDLIKSTCIICLVLEDSDQFMDSMAKTSALGRWSLGACAQRFSDCHQQYRADSDKGAVTLAVSRSSKDLDVILLCLGCFVFLANSWNRFKSFLQKRNKPLT